MNAEDKQRVDIAVLGHKFPVSAGDSDLTQRAADHINARAEFYRSKYGELTSGQLAALVALDIGEELFREREQRNERQREQDEKLSEAESRASALLEKLNSVISE